MSNTSGAGVSALRRGSGDFVASALLRLGKVGESLLRLGKVGESLLLCTAGTSILRRGTGDAFSFTGEVEGDDTNPFAGKGSFIVFNQGQKKLIVYI